MRLELNWKRVNVAFQQCTIRFPVQECVSLHEGTVLLVNSEGMWESGGIAPLIHNLGTNGGEWSASCPDCSSPVKVGLRATLGFLEKRILSCACGN
jgi:hypothetical protein